MAHTVHGDVLLYISWQIITCLFFLFITIHSIIEFRKHKKASEAAANSNSNNNVLSRNIGITTVLAIISYNIAIIFILIWDIYSIFLSIDMLIFGDIGIIFDCIGRLLFQFTFISRLRISFQGTSMQFSKKTINLLYTLLILLLLIAVGLIFRPIRWEATALWIILDFTISLITSYLFLHKLYGVMYGSTLSMIEEVKREQTIKQRRERDKTNNNNNNSNSNNNNDNDESEVTVTSQSTSNDNDLNNKHQRTKPPTITSENKTAEVDFMSVPSQSQMQNSSVNNIDSLLLKEHLREMDLVTLMTKYTLLVTIAFVSSLCTVVFVITVREEIELKHGMYANAKYVEHVAIGGNMVVIAVCLYLSYAFNVKYYKVLCIFCHDCCERCCLHFISANMKRDITRTNLLAPPIQAQTQRVQRVLD